MTGTAAMLEQAAEEGAAETSLGGPSGPARPQLSDQGGMASSCKPNCRPVPFTARRRKTRSVDLGAAPPESPTIGHPDAMDNSVKLITAIATLLGSMWPIVALVLGL